MISIYLTTEQINYIQAYHSHHSNDLISYWESSPDCNLETSLRTIENSILDIQSPVSSHKDNKLICGRIF